MERPHPLAKLVLVVTLLGGCSTATPESSAPPLDHLVTDLPLRADLESILEDGEICTYGIGWGFLSVGGITYRVAREELEGRARWRLEGTSKASALVSAFVEAGGSQREWIDPDRFLPEISLWTTAADDPHVRVSWFQQEDQRCWTGKYSGTFIQTREVRGTRIHGPLSGIFVMRVIELPGLGEELRYLMVEGADLHLVTLRGEGQEAVRWSREEVPCTKVTFRTDRLDESGDLIAEEPWNLLYVWVAEQPHRPILRMSGKISFGEVDLRLESRTVTP